VNALKNEKDNFQTGLDYLLNDDFEEAIAALNKAIKMNPNCSHCFFARGFAYENLNKTFDALEDYDAAINLNPDNADIYYYRGKLRMLQPTDRNWAIDDFTKCLELDPKNSNQYYSMRGKAYSLNQKTDMALLDFKRVLNSGEKDSSLMHSIGNCHSELKNYEKAITFYMEAVKLDPDNDISLIEISKIYSLQNKKKEAIKYLELATQKNGFISKHGISLNDYRWDNIRDSQEFKNLTKKVKIYKK
jgi:tetratricopeptide (TPR) repeat protein